MYWEGKIKDGYYIKKVIYDRTKLNRLPKEVVNYEILKNNPDGSRNVLGYIGPETVPKLRSMGMIFVECKNKSSALNFHPSENVPEYGHVIRFKLLS